MTLERIEQDFRITYWDSKYDKLNCGGAGRDAYVHSIWAAARAKSL